MKFNNPTKILYNSTDSIFNKITDINDLYNLNSYGCSKLGKYIVSHSYLANLITKKQHTYYCFVPCRKENHSYHLIFDFDNKTNHILIIKINLLILLILLLNTLLMLLI